MQDKIIFVDAGDIAGLAAGASFLVSVLTDAGETNVTPDALRFRSSLQSRKCYVNRPEAFLPVYRFVNHVPPKELTLERKRQVLNDPSERAFVIAHRGEHTFYPENSLESVISAWRCGADSAEIDIQKSADGIWMCMHDPDVLRTTNADVLIGKEGFPNSPLLSDWTYAQLRQLRLKDPYGQLTPFLIPTLEEMMKVCDQRIYMHLDKRHSVTEDIFPMMERLGIYQCVYLVNNIRLDGILEQKDRFADRNIRLDNMVRPSKQQTALELIPRILEQSMTPAIIPLGDYIKHTQAEHDLAKQFGSRIRIGAWFLRDFDDEQLWREAREYGISIFMTNHPMEVTALKL